MILGIGPAALKAYRKIRSIADHPGLSGVYQTAEEWKPDTLLALLKWRKGEPLTVGVETTSGLCGANQRGRTI